ncbi:MAG: hypothetical protein ACK4JC_04815 [Silanimonas lenta]
MRPPVLALALAVALLPFAAGAQQASTLEERMSAADFKRAGLDKLSEEELAALNAWLQRHGSGATAVSAPPAAAEDRTGFPAPGFFGGTSGPDRVESRVAGRFTGWNGAGDLITLANGQVWRVTDSSTRLRVDLTDPRVVIERNAFGGWQLRVEGYNTRARVIRVQ